MGTETTKPDEQPKDQPVIDWTPEQEQRIGHAIEAALNRSIGFLWLRGWKASVAWIVAIAGIVGSGTYVATRPPEMIVTPAASDGKPMPDEIDKKILGALDEVIKSNQAVATGLKSVRDAIADKPDAGAPPVVPSGLSITPSTVNAKLGETLVFEATGAKSVQWVTLADHCQLKPLGPLAASVKPTKEGDFPVIAWDADGKQAPVIAMVRMNQAGQPPPKDPPTVPKDKPKEDPPKPANPVKHFTFVYDLKPSTATIVNDTALRKWFKDNGIAVSALPAGDAILKMRGLEPAIALAGGPPCAILQDAQGNVLHQFELIDSAATRKTVEWFLGK